MASSANHPGGADAEVFTAPPAVMALRVLWLVRLRWVVAAVIALLGVQVFALPVSRESAMPAAWLWVLAVLTAFHNAGVGGLLRRWADGRRETTKRNVARVTAQTVFTDLLVWALVLHLTGGVLSPLAAVPVVYLAVAASLLRPAASYLLAAFACVACAALAAAEHWLGAPVPPFALQPGWAMVLPVAVLVGVLALIVHFTAALLGRLRDIFRRLNEANRQLAALDMTKSRFLRISSHQLRAPLAAVHSLTSALQTLGGLNARQFDVLRKVRGRTEEAMAQLDEMMLLSTIQESEAETAQRSALSLCDAIAQAMDTHREEAEQKNVELEFRTDGSDVCVAAWPDALETVFDHLLANAVRYTPPGGRVTVSIGRDDRAVVVEVADTGIGIPHEQLEQVFREFYRGTNARQVCGGTGLGLAIVRAIVERVGGEIDVESTVGEGTTVRVTLPAAAASPSIERDELQSTNRNEKQVLPAQSQ